jgi:hypothetical protein
MATRRLSIMLWGRPFPSTAPRGAECECASSPSPWLKVSAMMTSAHPKAVSVS